MKKILCSLLVVGLGLCLFACGDKGKTTSSDTTTENTTTEETMVEVPQSLSFDDSTGKVTWDSVNKASGYIVSINNVEYNVSGKTEYTIDLEANAGEYLDIKVLAISSNVNIENSAYSEVLSVAIPGGMNDAAVLEELSTIVEDEERAQLYLEIAKANKVSNKNIAPIISLIDDVNRTPSDELFAVVMAGLSEVTCSDQQAIGFIVDLFTTTPYENLNQFLTTNKADIVEGLSAYYAIAKFLTSQEASNFMVQIMTMASVGATTNEVMTLRDSLADYVDRLLPTAESVNKLVKVVKNGLDTFKSEIGLEDEAVASYKEQLDYLAQELDLALLSVSVMLDNVSKEFVDAVLAIDPTKYVYDVDNGYYEAVYDEELEEYTWVWVSEVEEESFAQYAYASATMIYVESLLNDPEFNRLMDKSVELEYNNLEMAFIAAEATGNVSFDELNMDKLVEILKGNVSLNNFLGLSKAYRKVVLALSKSEILRDSEKLMTIYRAYNSSIVYDNDIKKYEDYFTGMKYLLNVIGTVTETAEEAGLKETVNVAINFWSAFGNNLEALGCPAEEVEETKAQVDQIVEVLTKLKDVAPEVALELVTLPKLISEKIDPAEIAKTWEENMAEDVVIADALKELGYTSSECEKVKSIVDKIVATGVIDAETLNTMIDGFLGNTAE